jgi:myo-inositol-1(or 4)-monophosphatase
MNILENAIAIAINAGQKVLEISKQELKVNEKEPNNPVTNADTASEKYIIEAIKERYPLHGIIGEESSFIDQIDVESLAQTPYIWIIDPIDGTRNFSRNIPAYAISIGIFACEKAENSKNFQYLEGEMLAGVIHAPKLGETFFAEKGKGAFLLDKFFGSAEGNEDEIEELNIETHDIEALMSQAKQIKVSKTRKLKDAVAATGFPPSSKRNNLIHFNNIVPQTASIRRMGAAAIDMAYIAAGRLDFFWEFGLSPWDIAAGAIIIEEAGGKLSDTNGNQLDLFGGDILCSNKTLHKKALGLF